MLGGPRHIGTHTASQCQNKVIAPAISHLPAPQSEFGLNGHVPFIMFTTVKPLEAGIGANPQSGASTRFSEGWVCVLGSAANQGPVDNRPERGRGSIYRQEGLAAETSSPDGSCRAKAMPGNPC